MDYFFQVIRKQAAARPHKRDAKHFHSMSAAERVARVSKA